MASPTGTHVANGATPGRHLQERQHGGAALVVSFQVERHGDARAAGRERDAPLRLIQAARAHEAAHLLGLERREVERHGARADGGQQIVGVLRGHDEDQVVGRLFQRFEQRVGGLVVGAVHVVDQEDAAGALVRQILRGFLEQARLRNGDLAQRAVGGEGDEIRVGGEQQRIFVALLRGPLLARRDGFQVIGQRQVVLLDQFRVPQEARRHAPRQGGLADAFAARKTEGFARDAAPRASAPAIR